MSISPVPVSFDEAALLQRDHASFDALVRELQPRLFAVVHRIVGDAHDAQNVVQETFLIAYQRLETFRGDARLTTWIFGIGINQARSMRKRRQRWQTLAEPDLDRLPQHERAPVGHSGRTPTELLEQSEQQALVHRALAVLPESYRAVIRLRDLRECSTAETARLLGCTEVNVRVRLHRAHKALRKVLAGHFAAEA